MLSPCMAEDMDKVLPVISRNGSDSAMLGRNGLRPAQYDITKDRRLIAAGFVGCQSYVAEAFGLPRDSRGNLVTENYMTPTEGIFAAGDCPQRPEPGGLGHCRGPRLRQSGGPISDGVYKYALAAKNVLPGSLHSGRTLFMAFSWKEGLQSGPFPCGLESRWDTLH